MDNTKRMTELIELLNKASEAYYQQNKEIMTDFEFDKFYDELVNLEKNTGVILPNSPTQNVGYEVMSSLKKVTHDSKMLSLDKTKETGKLKSFLGEYIGVLSYKMDGLTIVLKYNEGRLQQAVTRGNGEVGEDITHNAKTFNNIPLKIDYSDELVIRGEAVISFKEFEKINENLEENEKYKNPRNLCSGTVRQLNSKVCAERNVSFLAFSLVKADGVDFEGLKSKQLKWLKELGFETADYKLVNQNDVEETVLEFQGNIVSNKFATDGLVLTYDDIEYSFSLGETSKFPKDSIAFKWADETSETTLKEILWNTSRTGLINPIAIFEPVELEGTTVERASLHNVSIVEELELGIGDKIIVYKANMIIPQVLSNITRSNSFVLPEICPVCSENTQIVALKDVKALKCTNPFCKAQRIKSITHYVSRDAMSIDGFSEATIEKFIDMEILENYSDIYKIKEYEEKISTTKGFGKKSFSNLVEAIENSKKVYLSNFIYALGINQVGLSNAKLLCNFYNNDINKIISATTEQLCQIEGFGEVISQSVVEYFKDKNKLNLFLKVYELLDIHAADVANELKLEGKTFVVTGEVNSFKNRKELQSYIESLGGKVSASVSSKTNYLINNDTESTSSKNKKAKELNVPIISEKNFLDLFQD